MIKKLQVFISSTYTDLQDERQAAVQAILDAGHIPAGMELFKPEDKSQIETIKRWIETSDVFMLILGGRYGSIEPDSQKSYIELEYRHAMQKNIPFFAFVIDDKGLVRNGKKLGEKNVIEQNNPRLFQEFKKFVLSKTCRTFSDTKDIKINFLATIREIEQSDRLIGWIRSDEAKSILNNPVMNESTTELIKVVNKSWDHKDYDVKMPITNDLCLTALIDLTNINQKFVFYFYFTCDNGNGHWVGYTNLPDKTPNGKVENTQDVLLDDTYHIVIMENIKKTIKKRFPDLEGNPSKIEKIRIRADDGFQLPINFHYAFVEKK